MVMLMSYPWLCRHLCDLVDGYSGILRDNSGVRGQNETQDLCYTCDDHLYCGNWWQLGESLVNGSNFQLKENNFMSEYEKKVTPWLRWSCSWLTKTYMLYMVLFENKYLTTYPLRISILQHIHWLQCSGHSWSKSQIHHFDWRRSKTDHLHLQSIRNGKHY